MHDADGPTDSETGAPPCAQRCGRQAESMDLSDFEVMLLAIASHDLRQPLQILQSAHERLGLGPRTKSEQHLLEIGQTAIDQLKSQLDQLVEAVRLHERARHMRLSPIRLAPLLREVQRENEVIAAEKAVAISVVPSSSLVISDASLMRTILRNLIGNAVKYTPQGGRILVGCRRRGTGIRIDVIDTGIGMTNDQVSVIFEAFTRLESSQADGFGIGLFIVRRACAILGHRIDVSSAPSRGTRFSILAERA
ncbi:sensor histidine kinase [Bradyrhizobium sp. Pa8]|uniref:sensor histidine kinase n=1 Tax=Bradyrhizobium sp. Pa8 TaxID=3386552 RepID=UPI00403F680F